MNENIAWAAGLFEGEGCFTLSASNRSFPRAVLTMTDEETVRRFAHIVGVGNVRPNNPPSRPGHCKPQWVWYVEGDDVSVVLHLFRPLLSTRRLERGEEVVAKREQWVAASTAKRACANCDRSFRPRYGPGSSRARFCSDSCRWRFHARKYSRRKRGLAEEVS